MSSTRHWGSCAMQQARGMVLRSYNVQVAPAHRLLIQGAHRFGQCGHGLAPSASGANTWAHSSSPHEARTGMEARRDVADL